MSATARDTPARPEDEVVGPRLLPVDADSATLVGRVWDPKADGPSPVVVRDGMVLDISRTFPTVRDLCEESSPADALRDVGGTPVGSVEDIYANTMSGAPSDDGARLLAPIDLQAVKAAGVTFAASMIERVIEEKAGGNQAEASRIRDLIRAQGIEQDLSDLEPGSPAAQRLKDSLIAGGVWSQYLEVGIGPDAEIFTKAQVLSAVGPGVPVGVLRSSKWNNPEPEIAVVVQSSGQAVGATLANDVNLRDVEGRSALLLGRAKDNNASCAVGPFIRLFDDGFGMDDVEQADVHVSVRGEDGFLVEAISAMREISRSPHHLIAQMMGDHHHYPDGVLLMLGTGFAPIQDRYEPGSGFTHEWGDVVSINSHRLGTLVNTVRPADECAPWRFGVRELMSNLARRGLL